MESFQDLSTQALIEVIDDNLIAKSLSFPRHYGGEIHGPNPIWFITGPTMQNNNGVVEANFEEDELDERIKETLNQFRARGLLATWWVGPKSEPTNLGHYLQKHGCTHNRDMIGMAMDLHDLDVAESAPADITFEEVRDRETLEDWYEVLLQGFPISYSRAYLDSLIETSLEADTGWVHYAGRSEGQVVTVSTLFFGGGVAGLYNLTTLPKLRGQGIGNWMTVKTYQAARERGYRVGTLQTTYPNALRMYHKMGFEVYCKIGIYRYFPKD